MELPEERYAGMTTKTKETSRILDAVHETARDLWEVGFISKRRMQVYDALYLVPAGRTRLTRAEKSRRRSASR